jgi:hypothetical protein
MEFSFKKLVKIASTASLLSSSLAFGSGYSCLDYYRSYVIRSTYPEGRYPTTVVIVEDRPHYRGHYPVYREPSRAERKREIARGERPNAERERDARRERSGGSVESSDDTFFLFAFLAGLLTTTAVEEDRQLQDAKNMTNVLSDAELGDGLDLRTFTQKVNSKYNLDMRATAIASVLNQQSSNLEYCRAGDLDSTDEVAAKVASFLFGK